MVHIHHLLFITLSKFICVVVAVVVAAGQPEWTGFVTWTLLLGFQHYAAAHTWIWRHEAGCSTKKEEGRMGDVSYKAGQAEVEWSGVEWMREILPQSRPLGPSTSFKCQSSGLDFHTSFCLTWLVRVREWVREWMSDRWWACSCMEAVNELQEVTSREIICLHCTVTWSTVNGVCPSIYQNRGEMNPSISQCWYWCRWMEIFNCCPHKRVLQWFPDSSSWYKSSPLEAWVWMSVPPRPEQSYKFIHTATGWRRPLACKVVNIGCRSTWVCLFAMMLTSLWPAVAASAWMA